MSSVTYRRLDEVLRSLGFSFRMVEGNIRLYKHEETGALVVIPDLSPDGVVLPHHLGGVRAILDAYGIADPLDLAKKLQRAS